jgi:transposase
MIPREQAAEIRRLFFAEHWKRGTIATQLGVHPDVVERALGPLGPEPRAATRGSILEPYHVFIEEVLRRYPRLVATRIYDMLRERGYTGSERTVRRYVSDHRPTPKGEVFIRSNPLPGEQAQIDWGHVGQLPVAGGHRALWVFVIVLAYSRAMWAELVLDLGVHSLRRSLVRAAGYFGGVTRQWLFDNPKTVVLERHGDAVRYHPALLELAAVCNVQPALCAVRKPNQKGGVERAVRFLKERFFAARTIHSVAHGNAQLLDFIETIAQPRPHPTLPERSVAQAFAEEQPRLLTLPDPLPSTDLIAPIPADKTAFVRFDTNRYSVPPDCARKTLTLVASDTAVRLLDGDQLVAVHARCWGRKQPVEDPEHRRQLLQHKRGAQDLKGRDRLRSQVPRIDELFERWLDLGKNLGSLTARTLRLLDFYGSQALAAAVVECLDRGTHDLGALSLACEQRRARYLPPLPVALADHVPERDVTPHNLGDYDD